MKSKFPNFSERRSRSSLIAAIVIIICSCSNSNTNLLYEKDEEAFLKLIDSIQNAKHRFEMQRKTYRKDLNPSQVPAYFYNTGINSFEHDYHNKIDDLDSCLWESIEVFDSLTGASITFAQIMFLDESQAQSYFEALQIREQNGRPNIEDEKRKQKEYSFYFKDKVYNFRTNNGNCRDCCHELIVMVKQYLGCMDQHYFSKES